ncbi:MAG: glycosyltransferase family 39 protein [Saprospiraceae bacterium]|nr:glycosyltransferase family 39 protein [Saprospiraceae bacterium]
MKRIKELTDGRMLPQILIFILFLLLIIIIRVNFLDLPLDRDEGTYAYFGHQIWKGAVPFTDLIDNKPSGLFFSYALIDILIPNTKSGLHMALLIIQLLTGSLIFEIVRRSSTTPSAICAAMAFFLISLNPFSRGFAMISEHIIILFHCLSLWLIIRGHQRQTILPFLLSGALAAWCLLIKQSALLISISLLLPVLIPSVFIRPNRSESNNGKNLGAFLVGGTAIILLLLAYHMINDNLDDMWYWLYKYNRDNFLSRISNEDAWKYFNVYLRTVVGPYWLIWIIALLGIIVGFFSKKITRSAYLVIALILSFVMIGLGKRFYGHYWIVAFPYVAMSFGWTINYLVKLIPDKRKWVPTLSVFVTAVAFMAVLFTSDNKFFSPRKDHIVQKVYGSNPFIQIDYLIDHLSRVMKPDETVFVMGSEPQVYYLLDRSLKSPHINTGYLFKDHSRLDPMINDYQQLLSERNFDYLIFVNHPFSWGISAGSDISMYQWAWKYSTRNYTSQLLLEIELGKSTNVVSGEKLRNYQPRTEYYVKLMKRRD